MIFEFASLFHHPYNILFHCDKFPYARHLERIHIEHQNADRVVVVLRCYFQLHFLDDCQHCLMLWNGLHFITYAIQNYIVQCIRFIHIQMFSKQHSLSHTTSQPVDCGNVPSNSHIQVHMAIAYYTHRIISCRTSLHSNLSPRYGLYA